MSATAAMLAGEEDAALLPCVCGPHGSCPRECSNRPRARAKRGNPEALIQRAIVDRLRWHNVLAVSVPNEGKRTIATGRALKGSGMRPGFPDLICMQDGQVAFLEVKAPAGRVSPAQVEFHEELRRQKMRVAVVRSSDAAVEALRAAGFRISER